MERITRLEKEVCTLQEENTVKEESVNALQEENSSLKVELRTSIIGGTYFILGFGRASGA